MNILLLAITAVCAYFLGGINGAIIVSQRLFHKDIRNYGSGNAGLTNFCRTFGTNWAALVVVLDVLKSAAAVLLGAALMSIVGYPMLGKLFAGFCLIMGNSYPVFYNFRGGKGVMCAAVMIFLADWRIGIICMLAYLLVMLFTRDGSLASIVGVSLSPFLTWMFGHGGIAGLLVLFCALLVVLRHTANIIRLVEHKEPKMRLGKNPARKLDEDF